MWVKFMETKNGYTAQVWKDLFNNCAVSVRVVPHGQTGGIPSDLEPCDIYVPWGKVHVAEEIVRKS